MLLLRGRMRDEVLDALRDRRQSAWTPPSGMLAREAFLRPVAPLPPPAPPPAQPGVPVPLRAAPPAAAGITSAEIARLAADAAARAWELLGAAVTAGDVLLGTLGGVDPAAEGLVVDAEFSADLTQ
nr:hypothetical protein [Micromonospora sp. ATA51]